MVTSTSTPVCVASVQAKLVSVADGLGHTNPNSWARGTGGDWVGGTDASPTIQVGTTLSVTAEAVSDCPLEYRFSRQRVGASFEELRGWSSSSSFDYKVQSADYGTYFMLIVFVRDSDPRTRFYDSDDYTYLTYVVE